jgi:hypothetical protein
MALDIKAVDTPIKDVLDQYYSWLVDLMRPAGTDRIALLSTIVTHDIVRQAPLYTQGIFRSFADRTLTISPQDFGPGNITDRYSRRYSDIISLAGYQLYANTKLTPKQVDDLAKEQGNITEATTEIIRIRSDANDKWVESAAKLGLKPGTPEYILERANFINPFLSSLRNQRERITKAQTNRSAIYLDVFSKDEDAAQLSRVYERCQAEENFQVLPSTEDIEQTYKLDPIKIAEAAQSGLFPFERELGVEPSGSLIKILDMKGSRDVSISTSTVATHNHDSDWHARASAWWSVFSASISGGGEDHFRQSLSNLESISISCDYMGEYWIRRRDWFDTTIFKNKYVEKYLKDKPDTAALLALCISSMVIVRGLKVKYIFKNVDDTAVWSSWGASGGFSVFGIDFGGLGGGGGGSSYDHIVDTTTKSVTFMDKSDVCRLVALRASHVIPSVNPLLSDFEGRSLDESELGQLLIDEWRTGSTPYGVIDHDALFSTLQSFKTQEQ